MVLENLEQRFDELGHWLKDHRHLWQPRPFIQFPVPWELDFPRLAAHLRSLSLKDIENLESKPWQLSFSSQQFQDLASRSLELSSCSRHPRAETLTVRDRRWIKERKWGQIRAFANAGSSFIRSSRAGQLLDWCGGKGHLGRILSLQHGLAVTLIDFDATLCEAAERLAIKAKVRLEALTKDVCLDPVHTHIDEQTAVLALHACGQLHINLLHQASYHRAPLLLVVPCCYHRIQGQNYQPLSSRGQAMNMPLTRDHLKLATTEQVGACQKMQETRHRWMIWRTGYDLLLREASGRDQYTSLPHFPASQSQLPFDEFCQNLSRQFQHSLPAKWNTDSILKEADFRVRQMRGLALVRWLFRRPLELWLGLDRCLYLGEQGYKVKLGTFCDRETSPRNLMIIGHLDGEARYGSEGG
jgi:hypothetical protein